MAEVAAVDDFVKGGGTVVAWNQGRRRSSTRCLPVRNGAGRRDFFTGGSIMQVTTDITHRWPARPRRRVRVQQPGATLDGFRATIKFAADSVLRSGFLTAANTSELRRRGGREHERGHVILFAFQPQWRGQPQGTLEQVQRRVLAPRRDDQAKPLAGVSDGTASSGDTRGSAGGGARRGGGRRLHRH